MLTRLFGILSLVATAVLGQDVGDDLVRREHPRKILSAAAQTRIKFQMYGWLETMRRSPPADHSFFDVVGELVRFSGHDFMSDFVVDGCIDVRHPENAGLGFAVRTFYEHFNTVCRPSGISTADCVVLLSEAIFDFTAAIGRPGVAPNGFSIVSTPWPLGKGLEGCPDPEEEEEEAEGDIGLRNVGVPLEFDPDCIFSNGLNMPGVLMMKTATGRMTTPFGECRMGTAHALATHRGEHTILPKLPGGGPPQQLSDTTSIAELTRVLGGGEGNWHACGMEQDNVVAMMGVHTLGRARKEFSGFDGFWVNPARRQATDCADGDYSCEPSLFDNQYYKDFFNMGWRKKQSGKGWECIPKSIGMNFDTFEFDDDVEEDLLVELAPNLGSDVSAEKVYIEDACFENSLRLNADMIIMYELDGTEEECGWVETEAGGVQSQCKLNPDLWLETLEYAQSDSEWLTSFRDAWKIMVDCNHARLFAPPEQQLASKRASRIAEGFYRQFDPWVQDAIEASA